MTAELWLVDLDRAAAALEALEAAVPRLSPDDRARAGRIQDRAERRRRLAAYVALRVLLERAAGPRLGPKVRRQPFLRAPGGKPRLATGPHFSLSHAGGAALIGLAQASAIGVDLEAARSVRVSPARRAAIVAAGAGLGARLPSPTASDAAFLHAWCRLEAFAKAGGQGLARTLAELGLRGVPALASPGEAQARAQALVRAADLSVRDLALQPGLFGSVALGRPARAGEPAAFPTTRAGLERLLA